MIFDPTLLAILVIGLALIFDFTNGFHDSANSIATVVATGTLTPRQAVLMAAVCNFAAMWLFNLTVAATVGKGIVQPSAVDLYVIAGALGGAITWNLITWRLGLPTSSSHALIGALIGATMMRQGTAPLLWDGISRTLIFIVASPCLGFALGAVFNTIVRNLLPTHTPRQQKFFRGAQIVSAALYSLGHGANDAQKTAGIIWLVLIAMGWSDVSMAIPLWCVWCSFGAMGLGTLAGGWRIVQTLGFKLTKLDNRGGFVAEMGGSMMLFAATSLGIPVSTTHTITGSILGVGASQSNPSVKWKKAQEITVAWVLTIPAAGFLAAACESMMRGFFS